MTKLARQGRIVPVSYKIINNWSYLFGIYTSEARVRHKMRLSIIRVNSQIRCWPADVHCGHA